MNMMKQPNAVWEKIKVVMVDKDIQERDVVKKCLPKASVVICLFHTLYLFNREVTCEKMGSTSGQWIVCLELLQKMAYARWEAEYTTLYLQLQRDASKEVFTYFDTNWHSIRDEWVLALKFRGGSFLNFTNNNRLESINGKLKQVMKIQQSRNKL